eukprot:m.269332 g.269332  ORF g.269332 m.269332 type:complete len:135 (-) comp41646_c0_seq1:70-474(-)
MDQLEFSGAVACETFQPHFLKPNFCTECNKEISKHRREAVSPEQAVKAISYTQKGEKHPSLITAAAHPDLPDTAALYLGGFRGILNEDFMSEVKYVVNTAKGFFPPGFCSRFVTRQNISSVVLLCVPFGSSLTH